MSRAVDIATVERFLARRGRIGDLMFGLPQAEAEAIIRTLTDAIAALRFVEEHGKTLRKSLYGGVLTQDVQGALEALRRLTAERAES